MNITGKIRRKGLSLLLAVLMLTGFMGLTAFAEQPETAPFEEILLEEESSESPAEPSEAVLDGEPVPEEPEVVVEEESETAALPTDEEFFSDLTIPT